MSTHDDTTFELLVALAREGLSFYREAQSRTADPEAGAAFGLAAEIRARLLQDLQGIGALPATPTAAPPALDEAVGFSTVRQRFDPARPEALAGELRKREAALIQLGENLFKGHPRPGVRRLIKGYLPRLRHTADTMRRLSHRAAA